MAQIQLNVGAALGGSVTRAIAIALLVGLIIWVFWVWPFFVASRIGERKGRRGWLYPLIGMLTLGPWIGVLVLWLLPSRPSFVTTPGLSYIAPSSQHPIHREDPPKHRAYVPPKRCPECKGLVPAESPLCGRCGHSFHSSLSTT